MKPFRLASTLALAAMTLAATTPLRADEQRAQASRVPPVGAENARKLDLNTADETALANVSVIGPELARALVAARPFATIDDLERVQGVSAERLEQIKAQVTVVPAGAKASKRGKDSMGLPRPNAAAARSTGGRRSAASGETGTRGARVGKLDVNSADQATLAALPSVGADLAGAIIAARPFKSIDDLARVQGVSAERLELLRQDLEVQPAGPKAKRTRKAEPRASSEPANPHPLPDAAR